MMAKKTKAQQEMIGFVLIVVIVVVAAMVILIFSLRGNNQETPSLEVENLLSTIMVYTGDCVEETPYYANMEDLVKSCYINEGKECQNKNEKICTYLSDELKEILKAMTNTDKTINGYQLEINYATTNIKGQAVIPKISAGNCTANDVMVSATKQIKAGNGNIQTKVYFCHQKISK